MSHILIAPFLSSLAWFDVFLCPLYFLGVNFGSKGLIKFRLVNILPRIGTAGDNSFKRIYFHINLPPSPLLDIEWTEMKMEHLCRHLYLDKH